MCPVPETPDYARQCAVDQSGNSSACSNTQTRYRNLLAQGIASMPTNASDSQINSLLYCPITGDYIVNPVITPDGITYERNAILAWLRTNSRDPMTRSPLSANQLRPNNLARTLIRTHTGVDPATLAEPFNDRLVGHRRRNLSDVMETFNNNLGRIMDASRQADRVIDQLSHEAAIDCLEGNTVGSTARSVGSTAALVLNYPAQLLFAHSSVGATAVSSLDASTGVSSNASVSTADTSINNQSSQQQATSSSGMQASESDPNSDAQQSNSSSLKG